MSAKQQNSSRIQLATKPLLILLPLMCGTVLISRGRRTQSASSVTVQQDTGQYRSGGGSDPEEASFEYAGLENSGTEFVFNYTPSSEAKTDTERINEAKQLFKTTALYQFVLKPLGIEPKYDWIRDDNSDGREVINADKISSLLYDKGSGPVEYFHHQVASNCVDFRTKPTSAKNYTMPNRLKFSRDSKFTMKQLKDRLGQIWQHVEHSDVSQISKRCIVTIFTDDGNVYLAEKDNFRLIESNGDLSSERVNRIEKIAHIFAIRLPGHASPLGLNSDAIETDCAIEIDWGKSYDTKGVSSTGRRKLCCICSAGDEN